MAGRCHRLLRGHDAAAGVGLGRGTANGIHSTCAPRVSGREIGICRSVERSHDAWTLRFDGEHRGAPLITQVSTAFPPHAWQSEVDRKYILARANGGWSVYSRFYDLPAGELPSALRPVETPSPDNERRAYGGFTGNEMQGGQVAPWESPTDPY